MKKLYYLYNGRSALNVVLDSIKIQETHEILYPEFACDVLFQFKKKNYKYNFYSTNKDFSINENLLKKKISSKTKVIILINFFGIKQNTKEIYRYCKKKKIILIIDDCHTYYNPKLKINYDCDFKLFSPGKLFSSLGFGGILVIYNKNIKLKITSNNHANYFSNNNLKSFLKSTVIYKILKKLKGRPKYENPNYFKSKFDVKNYFLSKKDAKKIKSLNYKNQQLISHQNYKDWQKISKTLKISQLISFNSIKHGIPIYFAAKCKNKNEAKKIFELGWKYNIEIKSWPTLNKRMIGKKEVINYWSKLVFFPTLDKINIEKKKKINWKI